MNIELKTKEDCVSYWVDTRFDNIDSTMVTEFPEWWQHYEFFGNNDESDSFDMVEEPMWNTWFEPSDGFLLDWIERNKEDVADLGFTIIYRDGYVWGLGIDGAGYSFHQEHWEPLYDLFGLKWHEN